MTESTAVPYVPLSITVDGVAYLVGTAGSLILACPKCGEEHFREARNYFGRPPFGDPSWHRCYMDDTQMEPIRIDELDSRWRPFWRSLGHTVTGDVS